MSGAGAAAVVLGAGSGTRVGAGRNKVLLDLAGVPILVRSVLGALAVPEVRVVVVVVAPGEEQTVGELLVPHLAEQHEVLMTTGGATRHASEAHALMVLGDRLVDGEVDVVAIHDGARPLAGPELWSRTIAAAREHGGALPVRRTTGLVQRRDGSSVPALGAVQTPQAFRAGDLVAAYGQAARDGFEGTDTAACLERYAPHVRIAAVPGQADNLKVTFAEDLARAEALLT